MAGLDELFFFPSPSVKGIEKPSGLFSTSPECALQLKRELETGAVNVSSNKSFRDWLNGIVN